MICSDRPNGFGCWPLTQQQMRTTMTKTLRANASVHLISNIDSDQGFTAAIAIALKLSSYCQRIRYYHYLFSIPSCDSITIIQPRYWSVYARSFIASTVHIEVGNSKNVSKCGPKSRRERENEYDRTRASVNEQGKKENSGKKYTYTHTRVEMRKAIEWCVKWRKDGCEHFISIYCDSSSQFGRTHTHTITNKIDVFETTTKIFISTMVVTVRALFLFPIFNFLRTLSLSFSVHSYFHPAWVRWFRHFQPMIGHSLDFHFAFKMDKWWHFRILLCHSPKNEPLSAWALLSGLTQFRWAENRTLYNVCLCVVYTNT